MGFSKIFQMSTLFIYKIYAKFKAKYHILKMNNKKRKIRSTLERKFEEIPISITTRKRIIENYLNIGKVLMDEKLFEKILEISQAAQK